MPRPAANIVSTDILGKSLTVGDHCLVTQNNRIILARVITVRDSTVTVAPVNSSAGHRRGTPPLKQLRRNSYNVYRVADSELTLAMLKAAI